jgi:transposase
MFSLNDSMRYLLYSEPTDMRKSYHTLSGLVTNNMGLNVRNGDVFIFINKARNRVKLLHLERQKLYLIRTVSFLSYQGIILTAGTE